MFVKAAFSAMALVLCYSVTSHAALVCEEVRGTLTLGPDPACGILTEASQFPDVMFLAEMGVPATCFKGSFVGAMGGDPTSGTGDPISGTTVSGLTFFSPTTGMFGAATSARLFDADGKELGTLFLRDVGVMRPDGTVIEQLVAVGSTRRLNGAKATFTVEGDEFAGAPATGMICAQPGAFK